MSSSSRRRESLTHKMMTRYLAVPEVKAWLMDRRPRQVTNSQPFEMPLAYACMYYPPAYIPRSAERYPLPKPFLDMGDVLLRHHNYDGIAVGTLHMNNERHALAAVRDSIVPSSLSTTPRTRNFAIDLRVKQMEVVEFAWMDDDSLIIACRRLVESPNPADQRHILSADLSFYERIPPRAAFGPSFLLLKMILQERSVTCDFCNAQGYQSCECPNYMKRETPKSLLSYNDSDALVALTETRNQPTIHDVGAMRSWQNYSRNVLHCSQTGSFFVDSIKRGPNGKMMSFPGPKQPIQYRFVCGYPDETLGLLRLYCHKTGISFQGLTSDTYLYGNGLSQGSNIGMLLDKHDDASLQSDVLQSHDYNTTTNSSSQHDDLLPIDISNQVTTPTVPSHTTLSNETLPPSEYSRPYSTYEIALQVIPDQSQCTEDGSLFTTRSNEDSPSSVLLDREEPWISSRWVDISVLPLDGLRHTMNNASNEWSEPDQDAQPVNIDQPPPQPRPLSTSNRTIQQCMTVNASGTPTCRRCGASFPKRGNLSRHIQTVHLKLKPFACKHCPARFGYNAHLKRHNKSVHQRIRGFLA